jgi:hypothetical protein
MHTDYNWVQNNLLLFEILPSFRTDSVHSIGFLNTMDGLTSYAFLLDTIQFILTQFHHK